MTTPEYDDEIEAIPTTRDGVEFRSRLEARWAAYLDYWHIAWTYEPEVITLPSGVVYIPDFWLPELRTWIEVKGRGIPRVEKAYELAEAREAAGELVLIGREGARHDPYEGCTVWPNIDQVIRAHRLPGHPVWETAKGPTTWLTTCQRCDKASWWTSRWCRACGRLLGGGPVYYSGARELWFTATDFSVREQPS